MWKNNKVELGHYKHSSECHHLSASSSSSSSSSSLSSPHELANSPVDSIEEVRNIVICGEMRNNDGSCPQSKVFNETSKKYHLMSADIHVSDCLNTNKITKKLITWHILALAIHVLAECSQASPTPSWLRGKMNQMCQPRQEPPQQRLPTPIQQKGYRKAL